MQGLGLADLGKGYPNSLALTSDLPADHTILHVLCLT